MYKVFSLPLFPLHPDCDHVHFHLQSDDHKLVCIIMQSSLEGGRQSPQRPLLMVGARIFQNFIMYMVKTTHVPLSFSARDICVGIITELLTAFPIHSLHHRQFGIKDSSKYNSCICAFILFGGKAVQLCSPIWN